GFERPRTASAATWSKPVIVLATEDVSVEKAVARAGLTVPRVRLTPFDAKAAAAISMFDTYNRTAASQRVADLVTALSTQPGAVLVADGDAGLAGVLAAAVVPVRRA